MERCHPFETRQKQVQYQPLKNKCFQYDKCPKCVTKLKLFKLGIGMHQIRQSSCIDYWVIDKSLSYTFASCLKTQNRSLYHRWNNHNLTSVQKCSYSLKSLKKIIAESWYEKKQWGGKICWNNAVKLLKLYAKFSKRSSDESWFLLKVNVTRLLNYWSYLLLWKLCFLL